MVEEINYVVTSHSLYPLPARKACPVWRWPANACQSHGVIQSSNQIHFDGYDEVLQLYNAAVHDVLQLKGNMKGQR